MSPEFDAVVDALSNKRYRYTDEAVLHVGLSAALREAGIEHEHEVRITGGRIDFTVGSLGIEVKIKGSVTSLRRQIEGYAADPHFEEFLVVTTRPAHRTLGPIVGGKPVRVLTIGALSL